MVRLDQSRIKTALVHLEKLKIFTIGDLTSTLKCSTPNARVKLKQWRTYTSYNQNGRYYTLPQVPQFDHHGLWVCDNAAFSRYGNLKKTIVHLVTSAPAGLTGKQLGNFLGLSPQSFMHHFRKCPGLYREKHNGVYVYFSDETSVYERQAEERLSINL